MENPNQIIKEKIKLDDDLAKRRQELADQSDEHHDRQRQLQVDWQLFWAEVERRYNKRGQTMQWNEEEGVVNVIDTEADFTRRGDAEMTARATKDPGVEVTKVKGPLPSLRPKKKSLLDKLLGR